MEKVIYLVWRREKESSDELLKRLLDQTATRLMSAGVLGLQVNVTDSEVAAAAKARIINMKPPADGIVSLWLNTIIDEPPVAEILTEDCARIAGYLVTESRPLVNEKHRVKSGQRTPGMSQLAFLQRPPRLRYEEWRECWQGSHGQIAIDTQSTFGYVQNVVVRPLTYGAPPIDAVVEENFPAEAMTDRQAFYNAVGDKELFKKHEQMMMESCARFIDFHRLDSIHTSEYVVKPIGG